MKKENKFKPLLITVIPNLFRNPPCHMQSRADDGWMLKQVQHDKNGSVYD